MTTFTSEELAHLDEAVGSVTKGASRSFAELVRQYGVFVRDLPGYSFSIYEYDNDVDARVMLGNAIQYCESALREKALKSLKELDEAFASGTVSAQRDRYSDPWHCRLPKHPEGELLEDIKSGNL